MQQGSFPKEIEIAVCYMTISGEPKSYSFEAKLHHPNFFEAVYTVNDPYYDEDNGKVCKVCLVNAADAETARAYMEKTARHPSARDFVALTIKPLDVNQSLDRLMRGTYGCTYLITKADIQTAGGLSEARSAKYGVELSGVPNEICEMLLTEARKQQSRMGPDSGKTAVSVLAS